MASCLTAGLSVKCIVCRSCDIRSIQQVEYLPLASIVNVSQLSISVTLWRIIHPCVLLYTFSKVFCSEIVTSVYHWRNIFPRCLFKNAAISKNLQILKGEGEIVNMDFWSSFVSCIAASCCSVSPYQTTCLHQEYYSVVLIML